MFTKYLLVVLHLLLISINVFSQQIKGRVVDSRTKENLASVNIIQIGTENGTISDEKGRFVLNLVPQENPKLKFSFVGFKSLTVSVNAQKLNIEISLVSDDVLSDEVLVEAHRVSEKSSVAFTNIEKTELQSLNLGQDVPYLLNMTPSAVVTSDAGTGIGYTGIRIRGVDAARINVTINGIPWNDAESHGTYWVDLPDLASSIDNLQIQRGVGTSTNGPAAFGSTIDVQTTGFRLEPYAEVNSGFGSFNTKKNNAIIGTGLLSNGWSFDGRFSKITSDGYVDRGWSNLSSSFFTASYYGENSLLRFNLINGKETTYQSWYGVSEAQLKTDRTFNYYTYDNQVDDYGQTHYQLFYSNKISEKLSLNVGLFQTKGAGYFEEYRPNENFSDYGLDNVVIKDSTITTTDLIRRKWLDNTLSGIIFSGDYQFAENVKFTFGGGFSDYKGKHFDEIIWAKYASNGNIRFRYDDNDAEKKDFNLFSKLNYNFTDDFSVFIDLQFRKINYEFLGFDNNLSQANQQVDLTFFNPKFGMNYEISNDLLAYGAFSVGSKEPTRDEYVNSTPTSRPSAEKLFDYEAGIRGAARNQNYSVNLFWMQYDNQLVLTGQINDVGNSIRTNVKNSYRAGIELEYSNRMVDGLDWSQNLCLMKTGIKKFEEYLYEHDDENNYTGVSYVNSYENKSISFSPAFIYNSTLAYSVENLKLSLLTKFVGKQYLDNTENDSRVLKSYFLNDISVNYNFNFLNLSFVKKIEFSFLINNIFNQLYESNGYTLGYGYKGEIYYENYYYPQAGRNILFQASFSF